MQELWFFKHSACCLIMIDIHMKFREDSLNSFQVIGHDFVTESKGNNSKSIKAIVMVLTLCVLSNID